MQQSSGSIGSLAAALARAQVELINPEKSMVATIRPEGRGAAEQVFRYASLSDGLTLSVKHWANMKSRPCNRPQSTRPPGLSGSRRC